MQHSTQAHRRYIVKPGGCIVKENTGSLRRDYEYYHFVARASKISNFNWNLESVFSFSLFSRMLQLPECCVSLTSCHARREYFAQNCNIFSIVLSIIQGKQITNLLLYPVMYRRIQKEDELLCTVWSLVMVRNQLPAQLVNLFRWNGAPRTSRIFCSKIATFSQL